MKPFEEVVTEHGAVVLRVCLALLPSSEAEDAWSETFLAALRAYPDLPPTANLEAWLVTIAHRKAIDATRARARRPPPTETTPDSVTPEASAHPDLAGAVRALPPKQRAAVAYHYLAGLPYGEVAAIVGGTPAAARRAAADGIATLRRTFPHSEEETHEHPSLADRRAAR